MQKQNNVSHRQINFPSVCACLSGRKDNQNTVQYLQDKQCTCVTMRRVRVIIVAVQQQKVLHVVGVCVCVCARARAHSPTLSAS